VQQRRHARGDYERRRQAGGSGVQLVEAVMAGVPAAQPEPGAGAAGPLEVLLPGGSKALVGSSRQVFLAAELIKALRTSC